VYFWIILVLVAATMLLVRAIEQRRFGAYLIAVRENEDAAKALGVDTLGVKLKAITLSAAMTALAGGFYAQYYLFVDSTIAYGSWISVEALLATIIGGIGTVFGPVFGALALYFLGEFAKYATGRVPGIDLAFYGVLLILVVAFARDGVQGLLARAAGALRRAGRAA
jgi:branched-chain amino acid transport system permease protein